MNNLAFENIAFSEETINQPSRVFLSLDDKTPEQKIKLMILRDLFNLGWETIIEKDKIEVFPPKDYSKDTVKKSMSFKRDEIIRRNRKWIEMNTIFARNNLANGLDVLTSKIDPIIEVCETRKQHTLFRFFRYYWSSPYSDYVGRRIKLLIRDNGLPNKPLIGIAALGSPIIHIPERDDFIGWDKNTRTKNLIYSMDAFVIGALPPYNELLGGKLISLLLASNEIRKIYRDKYQDKITILEKRVSNKLICIFTTSLYGNSSQYNRLKYKGNHIYKSVGSTKGYGTLHLSEETIQEMVKFLKIKNIDVNHRFGDGPSWVMRVIRTTGKILGFNADLLLKHSFRRKIYVVPLAKNYIDLLNDKTKKPNYFNFSKKELVLFWKERWLNPRKKNIEVINRVINFNPSNFSI
jgi:hypothetical protein